MKEFKVYVSYPVRCDATGYAIVIANSEEEAINLVESGDADIETLDIEEQEMTGDIEAIDVEEA